jgi:hypothetical protein
VHPWDVSQSAHGAVDPRTYSATAELALPDIQRRPSSRSPCKAQWPGGGHSRPVKTAQHYGAEWLSAVGVISPPAPSTQVACAVHPRPRPGRGFADRLPRPATTLGGTIDTQGCLAPTRRRYPPSRPTHGPRVPRSFVRGRRGKGGHRSASQPWREERGYRPGYTSNVHKRFIISMHWADSVSASWLYPHIPRRPQSL